MPATKKKKQTTSVDFSKLVNEVSQELEVFDSDEIQGFGNINTLDIISYRNQIAGVDNSFWPYMDIVLKMFYAKTMGNEHLEITDEDIEIIKDIDNYRHRIEEKAEQDLKDNEDYLGEAEKESLTLVQKMVKEWGGDYWLGKQIENLRNSEKNPFTTLVLALGRRSGKSFISALIASYEVYKLLTMITCMKCKVYFQDRKSGQECPHCGSTLINHPQSYYGLTKVEDIYVYMAATSVKQAEDTVMSKFYGNIVSTSEFFSGRYKKNDQVKEIHFKTEYDMEYAEEQAKSGQPTYNGSITAILAGANTKALHGRGIVLAIIDEFDLFNNEGVDTDGAVLEALIPATTDYRTKGDGRVIMISMPEENPNTRFKQYFKMGTDIFHNDFKEVLVFQMPTWDYSKKFSKEFIIKNFAKDFGGNPEAAKFSRMYGAQIVDSNADVFIPEKHVREAVRYGYYIKDAPQNRSFRHFMHLDCAGTGNCNYAYLVGHWEYDTARKEKIFYEDRSFYWSKTDLLPGLFIGSDGIEYDIEMLLDEVIRVAKLFRINRMTFDNMQSQESIYRFKKNGIHTQMISFGNKHKQAEIYQLLEELFLSKKLVLCCDDTQLIEEVKNLRRAPMRPKDRGLQVVIPDNSDIQTKDVVDCLAGAIYGSYKLPFGKTRNVMAQVVDTRMPQGIAMSGGAGLIGSINNRAGSIFGGNPNIFGQ